MSYSITAQILTVLEEQTSIRVAGIPEVKDAERNMMKVLEELCQGDMQAMDKAEDAIYDFLQVHTRESVKAAFIYGMQFMRDLDSLLKL